MIGRRRHSLAVRRNARRRRRRLLLAGSSRVIIAAATDDGISKVKTEEVRRTTERSAHCLSACPGRHPTA
jgi:hypothetical protein